MNIERTNGMVTTLRWTGRDTRQILFCSDVHYDSPKCDRDLLKRHFDLAVSRGAKIAIVGDWFDVMGTRSDRRMSKDLIREEYNRGNYLDLVVADSAEFLMKYAEHIIFIGEGNHETAIRKHQETDVTTRLVERINMGTESKVIRGGYEGYVLIKVGLTEGSGAARTSKRIHWHHGYEGGRRSKGALAFDLDRARWDADVYVSGHNHEKMVYPTTRESVDQNGTVVLSKVLHVQLGTFKAKDPDQVGSGWAVEKKFTDANLGCYVLHFKASRIGSTGRPVINVKAEELDSEVWDD